MVCAECSGKAEIVRDEGRAARNIKTAAFGSLGAAAASWFFNPFFMLTVMSVASGGYALKSLLPGNEQFTQYLSAGDRAVIWICAGLGIALAAVDLFVVADVLSLWARHRR